MQVVHERCCGLDVHKKTVVACVLRSNEDGTLERLIRTFSTMTANLLALSDWLTSLNINEIVLESTGMYWRPVFNILEEGRTIVLVNPQHIKHVPGRKTDVKDAEWLAELLRHGLLQPSFIPPAPIRELRALTLEDCLAVGSDVGCETKLKRRRPRHHRRLERSGWC